MANRMRPKTVVKISSLSDNKGLSKNSTSAVCLSSSILVYCQLWVSIKLGA